MPWAGLTHLLAFSVGSLLPHQHLLAWYTGFQSATNVPMMPQPMFLLPATKTINLPADTISPSLDFEFSCGNQSINRLLALLCLSLLSGLVLLFTVLLRYRARIAAAAYWDQARLSAVSEDCQKSRDKLNTLEELNQALRDRVKEMMLSKSHAAEESEIEISRAKQLCQEKTEELNVAQGRIEVFIKQAASLTDAQHKYDELNKKSRVLQASLEKEEKLYTQGILDTKTAKQKNDKRDEVLTADEKEVTARKERVKDREDKADARDDRLRTRLAKADSRGNELDALVRELERREKQWATKDKNMTDRANNVGAREQKANQDEAKMATREGDLKKGKDLIDDRLRELVARENQAKEKERASKARVEEAVTLEEAANRLEEVVRARELEMTDFEHGLEAREATLRENQAALAVEKADMMVRKESLDTRQSELEALEEAIQSRDAAVAHHEEMMLEQDIGDMLDDAHPGNTGDSLTANDVRSAFSRTKVEIIPDDSIDAILPPEPLSPPASTSQAVITDADSDRAGVESETMSLSSSSLAPPSIGSVNISLPPLTLSPPAPSPQAPVTNVNGTIPPIEPETVSSSSISLVPSNPAAINTVLPPSTLSAPAPSSEASATASDGSNSAIETERPSPSSILNPGAQPFRMEGMSASRWAPSPASSSDATALHDDAANNDDDDGDGAPQPRKPAHRKRAVRKSQQLVRDERLMARGEQPVNPRNIGQINERRWANGRPPLAPPMWR